MPLKIHIPTELFYSSGMVIIELKNQVTFVSLITISILGDLFSGQQLISFQ